VTSSVAVAEAAITIKDSLYFSTPDVKLVLIEMSN